ncbi:MAG TPA: TraB/GumN family protein [Polyangiaceae bacterium]|nr:TraB/GumN family protein [Polyangiaceae bacterium]
MATSGSMHAADPTTPSTDNVTLLHFEGKAIHLVGTAHISQRSVEEVRRVILELRPDTVCVELDTSRFEALTDDNRFEKLDIFEILRGNRALAVLASLVLTSFQRRLGAKLGVTPGAELLSAVHAAREVNAKLVLADRDVQATLKRSWGALGAGERAGLFVALLGSFFAKQELTAEQVEAMKDKDTLGELMKEFARQMPALQVPLIDERDRYLMSTIQESPGPRIVGVVGAAHVPGMVKLLGTSVDRNALSELPQPTTAQKLRPWLLPSLLLASFAWWASSKHAIPAASVARVYALPTAFGAALGVLSLGGRPWSALVAACLAPLRRLNPMAKQSSLASWVEARSNPPTAAERRDVAEAILSLSGMRKNPFTRVLLVTLGVNVGSAVGAWIGLLWLIATVWKG